VIQVARAPPKGLQVGELVLARPIPDAVWRQLEATRSVGLTLHAALRRAILEWLKRAA